MDGEAALARHTRVPPPCQAERAFQVTRKHAEKIFEALLVVAELRRKLPQERADLPPQVEYPGCEEVRQSALRIAQAQHMRDIAAAFDREYEAGRRLLVPALVAVGVL